MCLQPHLKLGKVSPLQTVIGIHKDDPLPACLFTTRVPLVADVALVDCKAGNRDLSMKLSRFLAS